MSADDAGAYYYRCIENRQAREYVAGVLKRSKAGSEPLQENAIVCPTRVDQELIDEPAGKLDKSCGPLLRNCEFGIFNAVPGPHGVEFPLGADRPTPLHKIAIYRNGCIHYSYKSDMESDGKFFAPIPFARRLESVLQVSEGILSKYGYESGLLATAAIFGDASMRWRIHPTVDPYEKPREYPDEPVQKLTTMKELRESHKKVAESIMHMVAGQWRQHWSHYVVRSI